MAKKFMAILIALVMLAATAPKSFFFGAVPKVLASSGDTFIVLDDTNISSFTKTNTAEISTTVVREYASSLKLAGTGQDSDEHTRYAFSSAQDWTEYSYINFWVKNTNTGGNSSAIVRLCISGTDASGSKGQWYDTMYASDGEWAMVSIPLSDFTQGKTAGSYTDEDVQYTTMCQITGFFLDKINGEMYIDKIWVSKTVPYTPVKEIYSSDSNVLNSDAAVQDSTVTENNSCSLHLTGTGSEKSATPTFSPQDWTPYSYVHFRVKNAKDVNSSFSIFATINGSNASGAQGYWQKKVTVTPGDSWQTVSVALPLTKTYSGTSTEDKYQEMCHIEGIRLANINGEVYLERIWLTTYELPALISSVPENAATDVDVNTTQITFNFNNEIDALTEGDLTYLVKNVTTQADLAISDTDIAEKSITLTLSDALENGCEYSAKISGLLDENGEEISAEINFVTPQLQPVLPPESSDTLIVLDDTNMGQLVKENIASLDDTVTRNYAVSLKLAGTGQDSDEHTRYAFSSGQDWTDYSYINFWVKNTNAEGNSSAIIRLCISGTNASGSDGQWYRTLTSTNSDWSIVSYALSDFTQGKSLAENETEYSEEKYKTMCNIEGVFLDNINGQINLDKIWLSKTKPQPTVLSNTYPENGNNDAPICGSILFNYSQPVLPSSQERLVVEMVCVDNGAAFTDFSANISENSLVIALGNTLAFSSNYKVSVSGLLDANGADISNASIAFKTMDVGTIISDFFLKNGEGDVLTQMPASGKIRAEMTAQNPLTEEATATLMLVHYDSEGRVAAQISAPLSFATAGQGSTFAEINESDYSGQSVAAFVVDDITNLKLLTSQVFTLGQEVGEEEEKATGSADTLTLESFNFINNTVTMELTLNGSADRALLFTVRAPDASVFHILPFKNFGDGKHTLTLLMKDTDVPGKYTVSVSGRKIKNSLYKEYYLLSPQERSTFVSDVSALNNSTEALAFLSSNNNAAKLGINETDAQNTAIMQFVAAVLAENKAIGDFEKLKVLVNNAALIYPQLNKVQWDSLAQYILNNKAILLNNHDASYFEGLSPANQNKVAEILYKSKPYTTPQDLRQKLDSAVASYKNSLANSSEPPSYDLVSSGGGGGNFKMESTATKEDDTEIANNNEYFNDLGGVLWAKDSIITLTEKNIISKAEDKNFRPSDTITRAEFIKLIVCAIFPGQNPGKSNFTDVDENDWSYDYISKAYALGITNGREDGSFGKNEPVSRQDMAAMICRALGYDAFDEALTQTKYADDSLIAPYAVQSVYALKNKGIMSGMGENSFAPLECASRAQAAVVIDRIMKLKEADNG